MEFVIVTCDGQSRTVFIDQQDQGMTGARLSVPAGVHVFDLGPGGGYAPAFQEIDVENTGPENPLPIAFVPMARRAALVGARKRARKSARKRAARKAPARKAPARRAKARAAKTTRKKAAKRTATGKGKNRNKKK
jgi:hypothetical protein